MFSFLKLERMDDEHQSLLSITRPPEKGADCRWLYALYCLCLAFFRPDGCVSGDSLGVAGKAEYLLFFVRYKFVVSDTNRFIEVRRGRSKSQGMKKSAG